ncbi:MAG: hypothetical protein HZB26_17510 [Candidatus Hydrogenedentes bacterium]|nr:hypothetical protein [Candidatus Hydrogenedentota bacterium]
MRLNLGCGRDYRSGWINVDSNPEVLTDVRADLSRDLPFVENSVDEIYLDNVIEHIPRERLFVFLEELYRICHAGARIRIYAPHYSGMHAFKHLGHYQYFGVGSFDIFKPDAPFNGERYSHARFEVRAERLLFFHHNLVNHLYLSRLPINGLFNFSTEWMLLMERFQFLGFDEIFYDLEVMK